MKQKPILLLSFVISLGLCACGGRSIESELSPDAGAGGQVDGSAGTGGEAGGSGGGGAGGVSGSAGTGGGPAGSGGVAGASGTAGAGGSPCALSTGEPDCDDCMNASCSSECNACANDTACEAFVLCALSCSTGDSTCMQTCVQDHAGGVEAGLPLVGPDGCLRQSCASACIASIASCALSVGDSACDDCVAVACMAECTACADNDECVELVACAEACPADDQGCLLECAAQNPGGFTDANSFAGENGCVAEHCSVECQGAPSECELAFGDDACDACISDKCLASCNACADNDACVALVECAQLCDSDDQGCLGQCALQNPGGITDANAFAGGDGCIEQKCPTECGVGTATCTVESGNAACDACIATECLGSCSACSENPDCIALVQCYFDCGSDTQCQLQCGADYPGGLQDAGGLVGPGGCVSQDCSFWCP